MNQVRAMPFADADQANQVMAAAKSVKTDAGNRFDLRQIIAEGVALHLVDQDGASVGGFVLQPFNNALWITAAAGRAGVPLCPVIDATATDRARLGGYVSVCFKTERRGLVAKTRRLGYHLDRKEGRTYYMRKGIHD